MDNLHFKIPVSFSHLDKALLGNDFLEHFLVYLDYDKKQIKLQPIEEVQMDDELAFIPGILNDSLWIVNRVKPDSQLQIGDTIQTINDRYPIDVFADYCAYTNGIRQFLQTDTLVIKSKVDKFTILTD